MTTNHPANGHVSLDRLHQISEILSKAVVQSDGGNLGYAMADAVKVIDGAIAAFGAEPVAWVSDNYAQNKGLMFGEKEKGAGPTFIAKYWDLEMFDGNQDWLSDAIENTKAKPLYTAPPAPVVPEALLSAMEEVLRISDRDHEAWHKVRNGIAHFRAAMLQAGNYPATTDGWIPVSERMPGRDVDVQVYCADKKEQMVAYMERNEADGWFRFASLPNGCGVYCKPTHWMPLPAAPQQEVK
ncbi:DUF551 domain-containing protein [Salmonella enterica]|nr:DUF551 domain-containing protein [Salmonella enterica]ECX8642659.1 DUF551 domain-containing protein [Salmonella enterica]EEO4918225.1 DUF551 domain-containing protein [Salmonella enterica]EIL4481843.1 DUF551 domain-containing protein [Salmonella enterica]EKC1585468.1 DUF551 domain-containing protein [Salmonella enterica]